MIPVNSSFISAVEYIPEMLTLVIKFRSGSTRRYRGVPEYIYKGLLHAGSKGTYFNRFIKDTYR